MFVSVYRVTSTPDFYSKTLVSYAQRFQNKCVSGQAYVTVKVIEGKAHNIDLILYVEIESETSNQKAEKKQQFIQSSKPKWQNSNELTVKDEVKFCGKFFVK